MRKTVIITLLIPVILMIVYSIFTRVYTPDEIPGDFAFAEEELTITAADGAGLAATAVRLQTPGPGRPVLVQVAERSLDRDWNSRSFRFRTGERLAAIFGGTGYHNLRFDHRGTGDTRASAQTRWDLQLMISDVTSAGRAARKHFVALAPGETDANPAANAHDSVETQFAIKAPELFYVAHDGGCALTLAAIAEQLDKDLKARPAAGVALLACDLSGSYLQQWGRKLLHNMHRQNVKAEIVDRAAAEWASFLRDGSLPLKEIAATEKLPPDLIAFREALRFMASDEMRDFRETAANLRPEESLRKLLRRGVPVLHLMGTMDAELPAEAIQAAREIDARLKATGGGYSLRIVPGTNHFLKEQEQELRGPGLMLHRLSPFRRIQPGVIRVLREFFESNAGRRG